MSAVVEGAPAGITRTDSQPRPSTPAPPSAMTALLAMKAPSALPRLVITGSLGPALLDFAAATGVTGPPLDRLVTRWGGGLPQYTVGHAGRVSRIRSGVAALAGLAVCGAAYDGVGVPACIASARLAAEQVAGFLAEQVRTGE